MSVKKIVVVGGVAAGASFAARARRLNEDVQITVLERGRDVSFANCGLPYSIGGEITQPEVLSIQTPQTLKALLNLDVQVLSEVVSIDRVNKSVCVKNLSNNTQREISYDRLMLAPGAKPRVLDVEGMDLPNIFTLRTLDDMQQITQSIHPGMHAVIVGAGFIGLEMAEQLKNRGLLVSIIQRGKHVLTHAEPLTVSPLEQSLSEHGVILYKENEVVRFSKSVDKIQCHLKNNDTLAADVVLISAGIIPESDLAVNAGLEVAQSGHIIVNEFMQTSDPYIYAAGDVIQSYNLIDGRAVSVAMGGPANRQGRVAADHIFLGKKARAYPGSLGTAIVRCFDMTVAMTGYCEHQLKQNNYAFRVTTVTGPDHASYYPGATPIILTIYWQEKSGRILGAQAVGKNGVDKRIDILATAIAGKMTIDDLCHLEFAYAPPFNSAKDIVNIAGFQACNARDGLVNIVRTLPDDSNVQIVDVRGAQMAQANPVANAINIPMPVLRENLDKLDKSRPVLTVCALGKNSYFGSRVLMENGFDCTSLGGGLSVQEKALKK